MTFTGCDLDERSTLYFDEFLISPPPDNLMIMKSLTHLNLSNNNIPDKGAVSVAYLLDVTCGSMLTFLNLNSNRISDTGAKALAGQLRGNHMLATLDLGYNLIGSTGGVALAEAFEETMEEVKTNTFLQSIGMDDGRAPAKVEKHGNKFLVTLSLASNRVGAPGALAFGRILDKAVISTKALSSLDLSCNNIGDVGGRAMQQLAEQRTIGNLVLHGACTPRERKKS